MEYLNLSIEIISVDGSKSSIKLSGVPYPRAHDKIMKYMDFTLRKGGDPFDIIIESGDKTGIAAESIHQKNLSPDKLREETQDFLEYVYDIEGGLETGFGGVSELRSRYLPTWTDSMVLEDMTQKDKLFTLLKEHHPKMWIRSQDLQTEYEIVYGERIKLSSISTYLSRFHQHGTLERKGSRAQREYRLPGKATA